MSPTQAAAVPYRRTEFGAEVLLITSSGSGAWTVPKGGIKKGDSARVTARLETLEEAGVLGRLDDAPLGRFRYKKRGRRHQVEVFALKVEKVLPRWAEEETRHRIWVPLAEASRLLGRPELVAFLTELRHRLLAGSLVLRRAA
jgi:8-oxo-dGTP pyrophosphatase MutT (NUDIX family)